MQVEAIQDLSIYPSIYLSIHQSIYLSIYLSTYLSLIFFSKLLSFFLVSCVGERPWWPIQSLNNGRKKKANGYEEREIRSSLLILDLKDSKF